MYAPSARLKYCGKDAGRRRVDSCPYIPLGITRAARSRSAASAERLLMGASSGGGSDSTLIHDRAGDPGVWMREAWPSSRLVIGACVGDGGRRQGRFEEVDTMALARLVL